MSCTVDCALALPLAAAVAWFGSKRDGHGGLTAEQHVAEYQAAHGFLRELGIPPPALIR